MAHEMGHYIACVWYRVDATLPFFLPSPVPITGTFGAFIRIRSHIPGKKVLFDIGAAGPIAGFVFLVKKSETVCKLRLLLVEPWARGLGIGARLISECVRFARQTGYKKMMLWTQSDLLAARHLYRKAGFELVASELHDSWGRKDLVSETWELRL
jgi:GNAT superfamily N-acetyltransferase